jgi:cellulose synthase/poly-beta-1,6-N-acetylglucosamine synthase-like glycosyltransferase
MKLIAIFLFWICTFLLGYVYVGYPRVAAWLAKRLNRRVQKAAIRPMVTVVVTAYNEEKGIQAKIANLLALDYPKDRLQIMIASDASSDNTDRIVQEHAHIGVTLLRVEGRVGKTACQNAAVAAAKGDVVVFTDATTQLDVNAVTAMVENFADPNVGCVAGCLIYVDTEKSATGSGGTAYWDYELSLRRAETSIGSLVGVSGCLYAVRRSAYTPISPDLISDFVIALRMRGQGLRTVLDETAICREETLAKSHQELSMRVRVAIRSLTALTSERQFLNPFRYGLFALQLWSHKALRYLSPVIWAVLLIATTYLAVHPFYAFALTAQMLLIALGVIGWYLHAESAALLVKPYYFLLTNAASLIAIYRFLRGDRVTVWKTVR